MSLSIQEFWKTAIASGLLSAARCKELHAAFAGMKGTTQQANALTLAEWLIAGGALSRYQASLLAAGNPGPFIFGEFVIDDRVETGRLAGLYRASYQKTQRTLIVFAAQLIVDADQVEDVADRTKAAATVKSPHVSRAFRFVADEAHPFVIVQDLQGKSVRELLGKQRLSWQNACRIGFQAALGLVALHGQKIVHGSLCPDNLWIEPPSTAKILQYPLVPWAADARRFEPPMAEYLAPELIHPENPPNVLSDIYALGGTLFELIAGHVPFAGGTLQQKLRRHQSEVPQRLDKLVPGVPEEVADLVAEMLDKEPLLRCQAAGQVAHSLAPFVSGSLRRSTARPPKIDNAPTTGYGAWEHPAWEAPPAEAQPRRAKNDPTASRTAPPTTPSTAYTTPSADRAPHPAANPAQGGAAPTKLPAHSDADESQSPPPRAAMPDAAAHEPAAFASAADFAAELTDSGEAATLQSTTPATSPGETPWEAPTTIPGVPLNATAKPRTRFATTAIVGGAVALTLVAAIVVASLFLASPSQPVTAPQLPSAQRGVNASSASDDQATTTSAPSTSPAEATDPARSQFSPDPVTEIDDDGQTLWVSPTAGDPIALDYLPSGAQMFVTLRPAEILANPAGAKLPGALGPAAESVQGTLHAILGVAPEQIEELSIAYFADDTAAPQAAFVMRLRDGVPQDVLLEHWSQPVAAEHNGKHYFTGKRYAYYLPSDGAGRVIAIAPLATMREILESDGPPLVPAAIEKLLRHSDRARQFNLLFMPSYLLTDGASLLVDEWANLRNPLAAFVDGNIEAVLASAHLNEQLFLELRATGTVDKSPQELTNLLRSRLEKLPDRVENYVATLQPHPYGRLIVMRFPRMVQLLNDFTRGGVEDRQAVLRCYLPASAAHNLLLGVDLTLLEQPTAQAPAAGPPSAKRPASATEALSKKISLSFPRDTLEKCLEMLAREIDCQVVILGPDLQLDGITKNQSFSLDEREQPAGEVLHKVLKLANPDGKLIYLIKPREGGGEAIFITTRAAATKRGEAIPAEFDGKTSPEKPK